MKTKIIEGKILDIRSEDYGCSLIADVGEDNEEDEGVFFIIHSWDESKTPIHKEWNQLGIKIGAKVKIILEME